ncbi:ankyrin repeat-containing protein BDA1-like [Impatiens glandulifera]|uniref:ankyrin repeat-containing protein BDA1-like n=1 Tax=Impatiens glandulifera TaxID=253017 RepID=UPI001FB09995|nr:ankyrin repeat-containing protein BDA1-like [Impatiens glandulifera]
MDRRMFEAAWTGDLTVLKRLAKEDRRILHSPSLLGGDNPLHIGCMASHHDFVKELMMLNRNLAYDLNEDGLSPLHIAAAIGDFIVVHELVIINNMVKLCEIEGKDRCIPLHCAVIKGRLDVVNLLIESDPDSIEKATAQGETVFHLAIKNNQFKTLQILLDHLYRLGKLNLLENKDDQGNTILHLATSRKQYEVIRLLIPKHGVSQLVPMVDVNATNENGQSQTPLDVLVLIHEMGDDHNNNNYENGIAAYDKKVWVEDILLRAGARKCANDQSLVIEGQVIVEADQTDQTGNNENMTWYDLLKYKKGRDSPGDVRNCLLVIVALITTATYQFMLSPPGGGWQENWFCSSVYMITLLTFGFPLMIELLVALSGITMTYFVSMFIVMPNDAVSLIFKKVYKFWG